MDLNERQKFILKSVLIYADSNVMDINSSFSVCPYCGGDCLLYPDEGDNGCDGYLGDPDGLLGVRKPEDRLEVQGIYGDSIGEAEIQEILQKISN